MRMMKVERFSSFGHVQEFIRQYQKLKEKILT